MSHPYVVLKIVQSKSNPDKTYEIRESHQDGKTYCTCPGWIFKARKGDGICKHIAEYKAHNPNLKVVVMELADFLTIKRASLDLGGGKVGKMSVHRGLQI
jgi:hypothetical protein